MSSRVFPVRPVTVTLDGVTHTGRYFVQNFMVYVVSIYGAKSTQVGGSTPEALAKLLLSEMVREEQKTNASLAPGRN